MAGPHCTSRTIDDSPLAITAVKEKKGDFCCLRFPRIRKDLDGLYCRNGQWEMKGGWRKKTVKMEGAEILKGGGGRIEFNGKGGATLPT